MNARLTAPELKRFAPLNRASKSLLERSAEQFGFSARAYHRIIRVARTIADLAGMEALSIDHLGEALQYRFVE